MKSIRKFSSWRLHFMILKVSRWKLVPGERVGVPDHVLLTLD
jgi:hypothetical protein